MKKLEMLQKMITSGANNLYNNYPYIDKLNVFPVPDGDTGTNMNLTITNALKDVANEKPTSINDYVKKFSRGLIMGARGNSGVIFSQIMKGLGLVLENSTDLTIIDWINAFVKAKELSYSAVMKPVEGTILTVIREVSEAAIKLKDEVDEKKFWTEIIRVANISLENTPSLLPVLKEVGVVDSGGYGLVKFLEGMNTVIQTGKIISKTKKLEENTGGNLNIDIEDEAFGYCTEAIVLLNDKWTNLIDVNKARTNLTEFGNTSIVVVKDDDILKIHTHALIPGQVLTYLQQFGDFKTIKIENMNIQADYQVKGNTSAAAFGSNHSSIKEKRKLVNNYALIAVTPSQGIKKYFEKDLNVTYVIDGGQKMNPSTTDFIKAIDQVDAKTVYIFPNDANVILTANQAAQIETKSKIIVIPTTTIPQGMESVLAFDPEEQPRKNKDTLDKAMKTVASFAVSRADKTTTFKGVKVNEGDYLGISDDKTIIANSSIRAVLESGLSNLIHKKSELITVFVGANSDANDINFLKKYLDENFNIEYEFVEGQQELYNLIIGVV